MLPAAKKKNKEHTWETSRTQWVCETIGKLPLREGIPGIKDPHRTGEHTAETGITGTTKQHHSRSLKKEEKCSQQQLRGFSWAVTCPCRRKSSCAPWTDGTWAAAAGLLWGQGSVLALRPAAQQEHSPLLLLGGQLPRQLKNLPRNYNRKTPSSRNCWPGLIGPILPKGCRAHSHNTPAGSWERICIPSQFLCLGSPSRDESVSLPCSNFELPKTVQCLLLTVMRATLDMMTQMDRLCSKFDICHFSHNLCNQHTPKGQADLYWQIWPPWDTDS